MLYLNLRGRKYQDMIEGQMASKDLLSIIQDKTGVNPFYMDPEELPSNDQEMSLYMQLNYKPAIEIAEEEAINTILDENKYLDIRKRVDYDLSVLGIGVMKHEFLKRSWDYSFVRRPGKHSVQLHRRPLF
jgi:hypothetical protein